MRRVTMLLAAVVLGVLLAGGAAFAAIKIGDNGNNTLRGTNSADSLLGRGGNDKIYGLGSADTLNGGSGADKVYGGRGPDTIIAGPGRDYIVGGGGPDAINGGDGNDLIVGRDSSKDSITCGRGFDRVRTDGRDAISGDCERVLRVNVDSNSRIAGNFKEGSSLVKFNSRKVVGGGSKTGGKPYNKEVINSLDANGIAVSFGVNPETRIYSQTSSGQRITNKDKRALRRAAAEVGAYLNVKRVNPKNDKALLYSNLIYASEAPPNHKFPKISMKIRKKSSVSSQSLSGARSAEENSFYAQGRYDYYGPYNTSNGDGVTFISGGERGQIAGYDTYTEPYSEKSRNTLNDFGRCGPAGTRFQGLQYCQDCLDHDWCGEDTGSSAGPFDRNCGDEFDEAADDFAVTIGTSTANFPRP